MFRGDSVRGYEVGVGDVKRIFYFFCFDFRKEMVSRGKVLECSCEFYFLFIFIRCLFLWMIWNF